MPTARTGRSSTICQAVVVARRRRRDRPLSTEPAPIPGQCPQRSGEGARPGRRRRWPRPGSVPGEPDAALLVPGARSPWRTTRPEKKSATQAPADDPLTRRPGPLSTARKRSFQGDLAGNPAGASAGNPVGHFVGPTRTARRHAGSVGRPVVPGPLAAPWTQATPGVLQRDAGASGRACVRAAEHQGPGHSGWTPSHFARSAAAALAGCGGTKPSGYGAVRAFRPGEACSTT